MGRAGTVLAVQGRWQATVIIQAAPQGFEVPLDVDIGGPPAEGGHGG
jgi:hypothetical protein